MRKHFMVSSHRTISSRLLWLMMGLGIVACSGISWPSNKSVTPQLLSSPPSWHGIMPGQTSLAQVLDILGQPDSIERRYGYEVYRYLEHKDLGNWEKVELWIAEQNQSSRVSAVFRAWPYWEEDRSLADVQTLAQLITEYGRPDRVIWTPICKERYLIWAHEGVAVSASAQPSFLHPEEYTVGDVLLFAPMPIRTFMGTDWPYPNDGSGWSNGNTCTSQTTDAPDTLPEDPYDWDKLLTATPSATTQP